MSRLSSLAPSIKSWIDRRFSEAHCRCCDSPRKYIFNFHIDVQGDSLLSILCCFYFIYCCIVLLAKMPMTVMINAWCQMVYVHKYMQKSVIGSSCDYCLFVMWVGYRELLMFLVITCMQGFQVIDMSVLFTLEMEKTSPKFDNWKQPTKLDFHYQFSNFIKHKAMHYAGAGCTY